LLITTATHGAPKVSSDAICGGIALAFEQGMTPVIHDQVTSALLNFGVKRGEMARPSTLAML
jgi:hypothetical protein